MAPEEVRRLLKFTGCVGYRKAVTVTRSTLTFFVYKDKIEVVEGGPSVVSLIQWKKLKVTCFIKQLNEITWFSVSISYYNTGDCGICSIFHEEAKRILIQ